MTKQTGKRVLRRARHPFGPLDAVAIFFLCAVTLVLVLTTLVPAVMGLTPYAVASESMAPALRRGDLLYLEPATIADIQVGEIVTIRTTRGAVITHRVYELDLESGLIRTKGDASNTIDYGPFSSDELEGRVVYRIPLLGYLSLMHSGGEKEA